MSLRESNTERLSHHKPDVFQSDAEKANNTVKDTLDNAASYLPGQSLPRDAVTDGAANPGHTDLGRGGSGTTFDAMKPSSHQSVGEKAKVEGDKAVSHAQPNDTKSTSSKIHDFITPGNDSGAEKKTEGVGATIAHKVTDAKDAVIGAFSSDKTVTNDHTTGTTTHTA